MKIPLRNLRKMRSKSGPRQLPVQAVFALLLPLALLTGCGFKTQCFDSAGCKLVPGTLAMTAASVATDEGSGAVVLEVARTGGASGTVSVAYQTIDGSAVAGLDYTKTAGTLRWADGESTLKAISVPILNQRQGTGTPNFAVSLGATTGGATLGTPTSTTVTITDHQPVATPPVMPGTLQIASSAYMVNESAGSVTLEITRAGGTAGAVSAHFATSDGTTIAGAGYTASSGTLSWADGDAAPKNLTVTILDQRLTSGTQTLNVTLSAASGGATLGLPSAATITILDNDILPGALQFSAANYTTSEAAGSVALSVTRSGGTSGAVSVAYTTSNGSGAAGSAFSTSSGTLSWGAGDGAPKTLVVPILDRKLTTGSETFNVALSAPGGGAALGTPAGATVTISDNDILPGTLQLSSAGYVTSESAGSIAIQVTRTGGSSGAVAVNFATADGTAISGTGYTAVSGTLRWADGDATARTIAVPVLDQRLSSGSENFAIALSAAAGGAGLGSPASAVITIADNDVLPGTVQLSAADYAVSESGSSVLLQVNRTGGTSGAVSVHYATRDGSASAGTAYTATTGTLTWADGDQSPRTIAVPILDQQLTSGAQTFILALSAATGGAALGSPGSATITIADNDVLPGALQLSAATYTIRESAGSVVLQVSRTGGARGAVAVNFASADGTAVAGVGYTALSGTLQWPDGDASVKSITVPVLDQRLTSGSQAFTLALSAPVGGAVLGSPSSATVTIVDNDVLPGALQFTSSTYATSESARSVVLQVTRGGGSNGAVSVAYATSNGSATAGTAYSATSGTLNWADGDSAAKTITVPIIDRQLTSDSEAFTVALANATDGAVLGSPSSAVVTISNNDVLPGTIQLAAAADATSEGAGSVALQVTRTGGVSGAVSISYTTADGSAAHGVAYTATSGTLNWADGDSAAKTITVPIIDQQLTTGSEAFTVVLANATGGATLGSPGAATVTITNNDAPLSTVQLSAANYATTELAGWLVLEATRVGTPTGTASVTYATANGTGAAGLAYGAAGATLTWLDGDSSPKFFAIPILDQQLTTGSQSFNVVLSALPGTTLGYPAGAAVTITDNDAPYVDFCNPQSGGTDNTATFCTTMNWPVYGTPTRALPANPTAMPGDGLKLTSAASNLFSLVMGTGVPGANLVRGQDVRNAFFLNYATGNQNSPFGSPQDTGQADNSTFAAVARHYEVGDPNDVHLMAADGLHLRAMCSQNHSDCSPGHVWAAYIRPGVEIRPGMTVKVRYKSPAGPYAWAPTWMFTGAQYSPGPGGNPYQNFGTTNALANYGTNGDAFEIDLNDNYPRQTNNPSVPVGEQVDYGFVDNYGVPWNVPPHYVYWAGGSGYVYQTNTSPAFEQLPFNWSTGFHDLVLSWGTDNLQYEFVDGKLIAVSYMEYPASNYVDGLAGGVTKQLPMNLMIGNQAIPSFTPGGNLTTDNDGLADGWTMTVQEISVWNGTIADPYSYQVAPTGCASCITSTYIALGAATYAANENGGSVTLQVVRTGGSAGAVSASYETEDGTGAAGTAYSSTSGTLTWADGDATPRNITVPILDQGLTSGSQSFNLHLSSATGNALLSSLQDAVVKITDNDPSPSCLGCPAPTPLAIINVRDYGAGLGAPDDGPAISNAFAAAAALSAQNSNEHVEVFFPAATYPIASYVPAIPNNTTLAGDTQGVAKIVNSIPPAAGAFVMGTRDYSQGWQYLTIARADDTSLHPAVPGNSYTGKSYIFLADPQDIAALRSLGVPASVTPGYAGLTSEIASGATLDETNGGSAPAREQVTNNQVNPTPALLIRVLAVDSTGKVTLDRPNSLNWGTDYNDSPSLEQYYRPTNISSSSSFILGPGWLIPANNYHHDIVIQNLTFETNPQLGGDFANSWGIYVGYSYNVSVLNCTFQNISGYYPILSVRGFNSVYDGNHFNVNAFSPLVLDSGSGYNIQNNFFQGVTNPFYNPDPNAEAHGLPQAGRGFIGLDEAPIDVTVQHNSYSNLPVAGFSSDSVYSGTGGSSTRFTGNTFSSMGATAVENFFVNQQYVFDSNNFVDSTTSISPGSGERQFNAFNNSYSGNATAPTGGGSSGIDFYDDDNSSPTYFGLNHGVKPQVFGTPKTLMAGNTYFDNSPVTYYGIIYLNGSGGYNGSGFLPVSGSLSPIAIQGIALSSSVLHIGQGADVTITLSGPADQPYPLYLIATAGDPGSISLQSFLITVPAGQSVMTLPSEVFGVKPGSLTLSARSIFSTVPTSASATLSVTTSSVVGAVIPAGSQMLTNVSSGLVVDGYPGAASPPVQLAANGSAAQKWIFTPQPDGSYTIQNVQTGLLLVDPAGEGNSSFGSQPAAQQAATAENPAQRWLVLHVAAGVVIRNLATSNVLDGSAGNPNPGVALILSPENDEANQVWRIHP